MPFRYSRANAPMNSMVLWKHIHVLHRFEPDGVQALTGRKGFTTLTNRVSAIDTLWQRKKVVLCSRVSPHILTTLKNRYLMMSIWSTTRTQWHFVEFLSHFVCLGFFCLLSLLFMRFSFWFCVCFFILFVYLFLFLKRER